MASDVSLITNGGSKGKTVDPTQCGAVISICSMTDILCILSCLASTPLPRPSLPLSSSVPKRTILCYNVDANERTVIAAFGPDACAYLAGIDTTKVYKATVTTKSSPAIGSPFPEMSMQYSLVGCQIAPSSNTTIVYNKRVELVNLFESYFTRIKDVNFAEKHHCVRGVITSSVNCDFGEYRGNRVTMVDESGSAITIGSFGEKSITIGTMAYCFNADTYLNRLDSHAELSCKGPSFLRTGVSMQYAPLTLTNYLRTTDAANVAQLYNRSAVAKPKKETLGHMQELLSMKRREQYHQSSMVDGAAASSSSGVDPEYNGLSNTIESLMTGIVELMLYQTGSSAMCYNSCLQTIATDGTTTRLCSKKVVETGDMLDGVPVLDHADRPLGTSVHARLTCCMRWIVHPKMVENPATASSIPVDSSIQYATHFDANFTDDFATQYFGCTASDWMDKTMAEREEVLTELTTTPTVLVVTMNMHGFLSSIRFPTDDELDEYNDTPIANGVSHHEVDHAASASATASCPASKKQKKK